VRIRAESLSGRKAEAAFVAATLATFVVVVATTLGQPLLERHAFRQTQTAYTARIFHEQGIDLMHPKMPVLGQPFEVPFEFPLFQAAASLVMDAGVRDDVAMRLTGLLCFVLTALLLYGLVRQVDGKASGLAALVAFVSTPFAVLWSRTSMIEYLATAGAVGFAWATIAWRENRRPAVGGLALAAGLVGMLVKPTTAVYWLLPALGYRPTSPRNGQRRTGALWLIALVLIPLAAALLWTRHADAIKEASPTTAWLTSDALREWNFGTLSQRLDSGTWTVILGRLLDYILGPIGVALIAVAVVAAARSSQRLFWLGIGLAAVLPPLVFTNLYVVHDYYLAAVTPAFAALVGLGFGHLWRLLPRRTLVLGLAAAAALLVASGMLVLDRSYWAQAYANDPGPGTLPLAHELSSLTLPSDRVGVIGLDWSPSVLYYANRWGLMVVERNAAVSYDLMRKAGYRYVVVAEPNDGDLSPLEHWRWVGALGTHTYGIADSATNLPESPFVATDDATSVPSGPVLQRGLRIRCGPPARIRSGERGTLILVSDPAPTTRVNASEELAPLPARRAIYAAPALADAGMLTLTCSGQKSLTLDVRDAPSPTGS
jgi:Dolichyl-phosphate-mannose-protein mannosyltransferase